MGSSQSVPQKLFLAIRNGSSADVQAVLHQVRRSSSPDAARRAMWEWVDPASGLTCLMLAASRNLVDIMGMLLADGADPHVSPKTRGTALHEAVAGRHDAAVELLLQHRADPFLENARGETAMDLAVAQGNVKLARRLERCALFCGMVNQKIPQLRGLASTNKDRWAVVMPRFKPPSGPSQSVGVVRVVLWVYRDAAGLEPRTKVWLDGASAYKLGPQDGVVRLHPNHEQPKNATTKYDRGWLLFFRPAAAAASTAGAREAFESFIDCCNRPLDYLAAAAGAPPSPAAAPPHVQLTGAVPAPAVGPSAGYPLNAWGAPAIATGPPGLAAAGSPSYPAVSYAPGDLNRVPSGLSGRPLQLRPADAPPADEMVMPSPTLVAGGGGSPGPSTPQGPCEYDPLTAQPGESDEAFAQRLSRMYGGFAAATFSGAAGPGGRPPARVSHEPQQQQQPALASDAPSAPPAVPEQAAYPTLQGAGVTPAAGASAEAADAPDEDALCVICLTNERQIGFLHGSSVHRCVCRECAGLVVVGGPCPLCRAPITAVLNVY